MSKLNSIHTGKTLSLALISAALGGMTLSSSEGRSRPIRIYPSVYYRPIGDHYGSLSGDKFGKCKNQPDGYYQQQVQEEHMSRSQAFRAALKAVTTPQYGV